MWASIRVLRISRRPFAEDEKTGLPHGDGGNSSPLPGQEGGRSDPHPVAEDSVSTAAIERFELSAGRRQWVST